MKLPTCLLFLLGTSSCLAQMPAEIVTAERSKILQGVTSVPKQGTPGPIAIWGTMAFPILSAPDKDGVELAVVAAAAYAKGRIILFGQNGYLSGTTGGDNAKLIENCVKWAGAKDKPRVSSASRSVPERVRASTRCRSWSTSARISLRLRREAAKAPRAMVSTKRPSIDAGLSKVAA